MRDEPGMPGAAFVTPAISWQAAAHAWVYMTELLKASPLHPGPRSEHSWPPGHLHNVSSALSLQFHSLYEIILCYLETILLESFQQCCLALILPGPSPEWIRTPDVNVAISRKHSYVTWLQHPEGERGWVRVGPFLIPLFIEGNRKIRMVTLVNGVGFIWSEKGPKKHRPKFQVARPNLSIGPMALQSMIYYDYESLNCSRNYRLTGVFLSPSVQPTGTWHPVNFTALKWFLDHCIFGCRVYEKYTCSNTFKPQDYTKLEDARDNCTWDWADPDRKCGQ